MLQTSPPLMARSQQWHKLYFHRNFAHSNVLYWGSNNILHAVYLKPGRKIEIFAQTFVLAFLEDSSLKIQPWCSQKRLLHTFTPSRHINNPIRDLFPLKIYSQNSVYYETVVREVSSCMQLCNVLSDSWNEVHHSRSISNIKSVYSTEQRSILDKSFHRIKSG